MRHAELLALASSLLDEARSTLDSKNRDYSRGEDDALSQFRQFAEAAGVDPKVVWSVFFNKHLSAIMRHVRDGKVESEPIRSRLIDAIVYLVLYAGLTEQEANANH